MHATSEQQDAFGAAKRVLERLGMEPVNPKEVDACPERDCARAPHELEKGMEHSWACYLKYDQKALLECDAILMLPGWMESRGAIEENHTAIISGMRVLYFTNRGVMEINRYGAIRTFD
jgi:hypothetical protein